MDEIYDDKINEILNAEEKIQEQENDIKSLEEKNIDLNQAIEKLKADLYEKKNEIKILKNKASSSTNSALTNAKEGQYIDCTR